MTTAVFLPGAGGRKSFWLPVANQLDRSIQPSVLGWPGFGDEPREPSIHSLIDLVEYAHRYVTEPVDLVAQSMGGVIAMKFALRYPELVRHLVLCGTSGGVDVSSLGGEDWRDESLAEDVSGDEKKPRWFIDDRTDLTAEISSISTPTLLIWGEDDLISPPAVGHHLAELMPRAELKVIPGGHDHPLVHSARVAKLISEFILADSRATPRLTTPVETTR